MSQHGPSVTLSLTLPITCHICLGKVTAPRAAAALPRRPPCLSPSSAPTLRGARGVGAGQEGLADTHPGGTGGRQGSAPLRGAAAPPRGGGTGGDPGGSRHRWGYTTPTQKKIIIIKDGIWT